MLAVPRHACGQNTNLHKVKGYIFLKQHNSIYIPENPTCALFPIVIIAFEFTYIGNQGTETVTA